LSENIFLLARSGDTNKLREFVELSPELDVDQKNHKGYSPLMIAVYNGKVEAAEFLLGKGVDPNSIDLSGNTILMGAAFKGDVGLVKLLLNRGALKEIESFTGFTAEQ
jgi:ankyrin repeat protein